MPLVGDTESQVLPPLVPVAAAVKGRLPADALTAITCVAGAGDPTCELKVNVAGVTARFCGCPTVRFTVTVCGLFPAPVDVMFTVPV